MGRVFMPPVDDPFAAASAAVERLRDECRIILVDIHAEASAEKVAMGWHLAGKVTAVIGTHTHVQTADSRILPGGTAYITDAGMTGPHDSIIGVDARRRAQPVPDRHARADGAGRGQSPAAGASSSRPTTTTGRAIGDRAHRLVARRRATRHGRRWTPRGRGDG